MSALAGETVEKKVVFTRANFFEGQAGRIDIRTVFSRVLDTPLLDCEEGEYTCSDDRLYSHVIGYEFIDERVVDSRGILRLEQEPVAEVFFALDLAPEDEELLELSVAFSMIRYAGAFFEDHYEEGQIEILPYAAVRASRQPVWMCSRGDRWNECQVLTPTNDPQTPAAVPAPNQHHVLKQMEELVQYAESATIFTHAHATTTVNQELIVEYADDFDEMQWGDLILEPFPIQTSATDDGKVEFDTVSIDLDLAKKWVSRWTLSSTRVEFGADPTEEKLGSDSILIALVPYSRRPVVPRRLTREARMQRYKSKWFAASEEDPIEVHLDETIDELQKGLERAPDIELKNIELGEQAGQFLRVTCTRDQRGIYAAEIFVEEVSETVGVSDPEDVCRTLQDVLDR